MININEGNFEEIKELAHARALNILKILKSIKKMIYIDNTNFEKIKELVNTLKESVTDQEQREKLVELQTILQTLERASNEKYKDDGFHYKTLTEK